MEWIYLYLLSSSFFLPQHQRPKLPDSIVDELHLAGGVHGVEAGADVAEVVQHHVHRHHAPPYGRHRHCVGPDVGANVWAVYMEVK